jgi:hypothetical protein
MEEAERIARDEHGSGKLLVISGVGTRHYYRKMGYRLDGPYMSKFLTENIWNTVNKPRFDSHESMSLNSDGTIESIILFLMMMLRCNRRNNLFINLNKVEFLV